MNGERRYRYQANELERLEGENKELHSEIKSLNKALMAKEAMLSVALAENKKANEELEKLRQEMGEAIVAYAEARDFYEQAAKDARKIEREFKELIIQLGIDIKQ